MIKQINEECFKKGFAELFKEGSCTKEEFKCGINKLINDDKLEVDDITGIVNTTEPTDSVELKKEYYQGQSNEKQYENVDLHIIDGYVRRNDGVCLYVPTEIVSELNRLSYENKQLKQLPNKLDNRIQKLKTTLQELTMMDKTDLNPQSVNDIGTIISISLNALQEFKKEL